MKIDPGTQNDDQKKIANYVSMITPFDISLLLQGVQKLPPNHHQKGNHFVKVKIIIPKKLNEAQKKAMEAFAMVEDPAPNTTTEQKSQ